MECMKTSKLVENDIVKKWNKNLSLVLIIGGLLGLLASFVLTLDKIRVSADATFSPDCNLNPVLSCVSVMQSPQSELFGFPNQMIGIAAFSVLIAFGVLMRLTKGFDRIVWRLLALGGGLGFLLILWMIGQSLFILGALCLWCMLTWVVVSAIAWYSLVYNLKFEHIKLPQKLQSLKAFILQNHLGILVAWYLLIIFGITYKFWYYWETLL